MADEIVEEFLVESAEGLERVEQDLVELEEDTSRSEVVDRIFRDIHTIKGVSGFLGYTSLERVTHASESLLSKVRAGEVKVDERVISALLGTVDATREMLERIEQTESDGGEDYAALISQLEALQQSAIPAPPPAPALALAPEPPPAPASAAGEELPEAPPSVPPLGEVLVALGVVPEDAVASALKQQREGDPRKLGEILVRDGKARPAQIEEALDAQRTSRTLGTNAKDATIRVSVDLLDRLMNLVGELVLVRNQILQHTQGADDPAAATNAQRLNHVTSELQEGVMKTRMQPIKTIWGKLPRIVRDLAGSFDKEMRLEMEGRDTELDKTIIEAIKDPLTHLVRNACDHGMEMPAERVAKGKPAEGVLRLRAYHEGGQVIIEVADDGKGIDPEKIKASAVAKGLLTAAAAERLSERDALNLIFLPGFSTAAQVTNVSGRGVGMDVVKTNIERIGGTIDLSSVLGAGTTIRVKIPLTLAIIPALVVHDRGERYAIPQVSVLELVLLEGEEMRRVEAIHGTPVYRLRGKLLPIVHLSEQLGLGPAEGPPPEALNIIVLQADGHPFGLVVEGVRDTEEIVVKPLGKELKSLSAYAGATIMGDGAVALILDVLGLAQHAGIVREDGASASNEDASEPSDRALHEQEALLLFESDGKSPLAVELARIDRLEELDAAAVEHTGGRDVVQYRDTIMPLVHLSHEVYGRPLEVARERAPDERYQVVVVRRGAEVYGLVVGHLVDIVDTAVEARPVGRRPGIRGSAIVQGRVVELLDVDAVLAAALPEVWAHEAAAGGV